MLRLLSAPVQYAVIVVSVCGLFTGSALSQTEQPMPRIPISSILQNIDLPAAERIGLKPKYQIKKTKNVRFWKGLDRQTVIVKFHDGLAVRAHNPSDLNPTSVDDDTLIARLRTLDAARIMDAYDAALRNRRGLSRARVAQDMKKFRDIVSRDELQRWGKVFQVPVQALEQMRKSVELRTGRQASDMANYYWFEFEKGTRGEQIATQIIGLGIIEDAYLAPVPQDPQDLPPTTQNFQTSALNTLGLSQGYLASAPNGIDANFAWTVPGGAGAGITVVDMEQGWVLNHEDLPNMVYTSGRVDSGDGNHGTAVMSVMVGVNNGFGVTGIAFNAFGGVASYNRNYGGTYYANVGDAIAHAAWRQSVGDVIVIEQHAQFLNGQENCTACTTGTGAPSDQCGLIAMEYWSHIFDAISAASASGLIVVEAAGNGQQNLNNQRYQQRFNRNWRNSGAILVGAGGSPSKPVPRGPACFTNYGTRVDLQGWGDSVMSAGYGKFNGGENAVLRPAGSDNKQWYSNAFNGTSSATPIVAGAVLSVQGVQRANGYPPLNWFEVKELLASTGTPQAPGNNIGPLPNLQAALTQLAVRFPPPSNQTTTNPVPRIFENVLRFGTTVQLSSGVAGVAGTTRVFDAQTQLLLPGFPTSIAPLDLQERVIAGITLGERNDKPCYMLLDRVNMVEKETRGARAYNICRKNSPVEASKRRILTSARSGNFVTGIDVCMTRNGRHPARIKGLRYHKSYVSKNGTLTPRTGVKWEIDRANCNNTWIPSYCPTDWVATQMIVHTRADDKNTNRGERSFSGFQLGCKRLIVDRVCIANC